jgi:hypothetical protein
MAVEHKKKSHIAGGGGASNIPHPFFFAFKLFSKLVSRFHFPKNTFSL